MALEIPLIDLGGLQAGDPLAEAEVAAALGRACREVGFFYIVNHGIAPQLRAKVFAAAAAFFALPTAQKDAVSIARSLHNRGYVGMEAERLDTAQGADLKEAFNIGLDLSPDHPDVLAGKPFHAPNQWPVLPGLRDTLGEYFTAMQRLAERIHRAFSIDLGLDADFFAPYIDDPMAVLRMLHYPPNPVFDGKQFGAGAHTDYGNLTILAQDAVGGLEVRTRAGDWVSAVPVDNAFVCNIGDCLMRWSNDVYVSTPHRVVNHAGRERYSVAFFFDPNADAPVQCLPSCTDAANPPRYAPISGADYLRSRLDATFAFRREVAPA